MPKHLFVRIFEGLRPKRDELHVSFQPPLPAMPEVPASPVPPPAQPKIAARSKQPTKPSAKPRPTIADVTVIVVNYKTAALVRTAVTSLLKAYSLPVLLVDNGSNDDSTDAVNGLARAHKRVLSIFYTHNLGHGPAMHKAIKLVDTRYFLTLDSDCEVLKPGFLELMLDRFTEVPNLYALGWRRWVDKLSGVPKEWHLKKPPPERFVAYAHPAASLYNTARYRELKGFFHHGAPCLQNMVDAEAHGYLIEGFPIFDYIKHLEAGTRRMYAGRWDPKDSDRPTEWKANRRYPI